MSFSDGIHGSDKPRAQGMFEWEERFTPRVSGSGWGTGRGYMIQMRTTQLNEQETRWVLVSCISFLAWVGDDAIGQMVNSDNLFLDFWL